MTTIEYCEKRGQNANYTSPYDLGIVSNIKSIMGEEWYLWPVPVGRPPGDGFSWQVADCEALALEDESGAPVAAVPMGCSARVPGSCEKCSAARSSSMPCAFASAVA